MKYLWYLDGSGFLEDEAELGFPWSMTLHQAFAEPDPFLGQAHGEGPGTWMLACIPEEDE